MEERTELELCEADEKLDEGALMLIERLLPLPTELKDGGITGELLAEVEILVKELGDSVGSGYGSICVELDLVVEGMVDEIDEVEDSGYG